MFGIAGLFPESGRAVEVARIEIFGAGADGRVPALVGPDASRQLVVTAVGTEGEEWDVTGAVDYVCEPDGIIRVTEGGRVTPVADGETELRTVLSGTAIEGRATLRVESFAISQPINFPNEIVPIFTKAGCNGGGCHGKAGGQNGFRLSLLGFEPEEDYEYLVREGRGRRIFPAAPDYSLLLRKALGDMPHGGGGRMKADSEDYRSLVRWIRKGMPYGSPDDPVVTRIAVHPKKRILLPGASQQLAVIAHYTDGSARDVTGLATFGANDKEMAEAEEGGRVTVADGTTGDVAVMVRFQEHVDVFQAMVPLGAPVEALPEHRNFIDDLVFGKLKALGLPPSEVCDDTTFLRRACADITGRIPTPEETLAFMNDSDPGKRAKWVETLLASTDYADYFANKWSAILRNKQGGNDANARGTRAFYSWIRQSLHENLPYSEIAARVVAAKGDILANPPAAWYRAVNKQEEQLQDVAQVFLGVRLQCAQCHHHPYEKWSQQDYFGFSAFFAQVGRKSTGRPGEEAVIHRVGKAMAQNKKTGKAVPPMPLGGGELEIEPEDDPREALAEWMTATENPFFARMLVNRYWKHFFNRALVEPEDDMRVTNPPTNPDLLDALAQAFVASGYDLKELVRTICNSTSYQLSAIPNAYNASDRQNYSRYFPKRLSAEVLLDSIDALTGAPTRFDGQLEGTRAVQLPDEKANRSSYFLTVFGRPEMDSACECERASGASLAQTLHLLNAKSIQEKLGNNEGRAAELAGNSERLDGDKIRELYLCAFSREPAEGELELARQYLEGKTTASREAGGDEGKARREAYEDLVWALMNTKEFLFNH